MNNVFFVGRSALSGSELLTSKRDEAAVIPLPEGLGGDCISLTQCCNPAGHRTFSRHERLRLRPGASRAPYYRTDGG